MRPEACERTVEVFIGSTGTGKSREAWTRYPNAYPKDPCTKYWCGYTQEEEVIIDEFRGQIGISHILRWFDRYPVTVEVKGGACVFRAKRIIVTSNLPVNMWYPELDEATLDALKRRISVRNFTTLSINDLS